MRLAILLTLTTAALPLAQACYQLRGQIEQQTNKATLTTKYLPSIFLFASGNQVCNGHSGFGSGSESNPYQPDFIPGGVPTNSSFSGPWSGANCSEPYTNAEVFSINGQALIRDYKSAFFVLPEQMNWLQVATAQGVAGIPNVVSSVWTFDSGNVHC